MTLDQPFSNHNGGMLSFGQEGYLYIATGDGGGGGDPLDNAERVDNLFGKILRIDVNSLDPYGIPADNPFVGVPNARAEIWAYGLRNPWRFSFDRDTGDLWIGDVGQNQWEEINLEPADSSGGENYGWDFLEGLHIFEAPTGVPSGLAMPISEYSHASGDCSITGGYVYRGNTISELAGTYIYGDYCTGRIWGLRERDEFHYENSLLIDTPYFISSFGEDESGELYLCSHIDGTILKLAP